MTVVMVEISIKKMETNILNSFFTEIFVSPCVYILKITNMSPRIYIYILIPHRVKFLLAFGLDFCLPVFRVDFF